MIKPGTSTLVQLPAVSFGADTAMQFQDWLEVTSAGYVRHQRTERELVRTLMEKVESTYKMWLSATPLERLGITPVGAEDLLFWQVDEVERKGGGNATGSDQRRAENGYGVPQDIHQCGEDHVPLVRGLPAGRKRGKERMC